jgi:hypothetical protein
MLAWGFATLEHRPPEGLLDDIAAVTLRRLPEFEPQVMHDLSSLAPFWTLATYE